MQRTVVDQFAVLEEQKNRKRRFEVPANDVSKNDSMAYSSGNLLELDDKICTRGSENATDTEKGPSIVEGISVNSKVNSSRPFEKPVSNQQDHPSSSSERNEKADALEKIESKNDILLDKDVSKISASQMPESPELSKDDESPTTSHSGGKKSAYKVILKSKKNLGKGSVNSNVKDVLSDAEFHGPREDDISILHIAQEVTPMKPIEGVHTFLVDYNLLFDNKIQSYPEVYVDDWRPGQVRLPCSHQCMLKLSRCVNTNKNKVKQAQQNKFSAVLHWEVVHARLTDELSTIDDLLIAMEGYNPGFIELYGSSYRKFFSSCLKCDESAHFFSILLPKLQHLALQLPSLVTQEIPLLAQNTNMSLTLSKKQIASLVANMFLNTFPYQDKSLPKYHNFFTLFCSKAPGRQKSNFEKVKCLLNYFNRLLTQDEDFNDLQGVVSFHRRSLNEEESPKWDSLDLPLTFCQVEANGLIEDQNGTLQVDFADRFVGGRVLGDGCVQEEIRFVIHPELYVSLLFTPQLLDNECLIVQGAERYCNYSGYGNSFRFINDHVDVNSIDMIGRKFVTVVAIDATQFRRRVKKQDQYQASYLLRELNKAYIGFKPALLPQREKDRPTAVATGNWGCGIFGGIKTLKFIIQWMAASCAGRDVLYLTFHDEKLASDLNKVKDAFLKKPYTVKEVWELLCQYNKSNFKQTFLDFLVS